MGVVVAGGGSTRSTECIRIVVYTSGDMCTRGEWRRSSSRYTRALVVAGVIVAVCVHVPVGILEAQDFGSQLRLGLVGVRLIFSRR